MNQFFQKYLGKFVLLCFDDILVFSKDEEEHVAHIHKVLKILRKHQLYAKLSKCHFAKDELHYLGHVVGKYGNKVDPAKIKTIMRWNTPQDVGQLHSFLGLCDYSRCFILGYSTLVAILTNLIWHDFKYNWTVERQEAFDKVKYALTHAHVLALPTFGEFFEVICDVFIVGIGTISFTKKTTNSFWKLKVFPYWKDYIIGEP